MPISRNISAVLVIRRCPESGTSGRIPGKAHVQSVSVSRTYQGMSVVASGLSGGEDVIVDGQLLLSEGTPVAPRTPKAGA
jgi:hypothetical protein